MEKTFGDEFSKRLEELINETGESINSFEKKVNVSIGAIYKPINNKKTIGAEAISKILLTFKDFDITYLLTGIKTTHLKPTPQIKSIQENEELEEKKYVIKLQKQRIQELEEKIRAYESAKQTPQRSMAYTTNQ